MTSAPLLRCQHVDRWDMGRSELDDLDRPPSWLPAGAVPTRRTPDDTLRAAYHAFAVWSLLLVVMTPFLGMFAGPAVALAGVVALAHVARNLAPELRPAGLVGLVALLLVVLPFT